VVVFPWRAFGENGEGYVRIALAKMSFDSLQALRRSRCSSARTSQAVSDDPPRTKKKDPTASRYRFMNSKGGSESSPFFL
jgi:hypothetical protein